MGFRGGIKTRSQKITSACHSSHRALGRDSRGSWSADPHIQPLSRNSTASTQLPNWKQNLPYP